MFCVSLCLGITICQLCDHYSLLLVIEGGRKMSGLLAAFLLDDELQFLTQSVSSYLEHCYASLASVPWGKSTTANY